MAKQAKKVRAGRTSASAAGRPMLVGGKELADAIRATFPTPESKADAETPQSHWSDEQVQTIYDLFAKGISAAYGHVTRLARAIVKGEVSDNQVRDLWATRKEDDSARKFLSALKEGLRTAQADADGNLPGDAFTYNVHPKTKVLVREKIQSREREFSGPKLAARVAKLVIKYKLDGKQRERLAAMLTEACVNAEAFAAGAKSAE